ncbi:hypothetical protein ACFL35_06510 [Candidatus Riflebacteria bacterium]
MSDKRQKAPIYFLVMVLIFIGVFDIGCIWVNDNNNNAPVVGTGTTTSTTGTTISGTTIFPSNTAVASIKDAKIKGVVNYSVLRVYINNVFYGFLSTSGTFTFSNVPLATEYEVEIKNNSEILLLKSLQAATVQTINSTTTAQALVLEQARLSNSSLSISSVSATMSEVLSLVTLIETALADSSSLSTTTTISTKSIYTSTTILSGITTGATVVIGTATTSTTTTTTSTSTTSTTTTTTTTTSTSTTTSTAIYSSSSADSTQVDRMGYPGISTLLLKSEDQAAYNAGSPADDYSNYRTKIASAAQSYGYINGLEALALVDGIPLYPDALVIDASATSQFPNGRKLDDDITDTMLNLVSSGTLASDSVSGNDETHSSSFPYMAGPH